MSSQANADRLRYLWITSVYAKHDFAIGLCLTMTTFPLAPGLAVLMPLAWIRSMWLVKGRDKLPETLEDDLRTRFSIPPNVMLARTSDTDCALFSMQNRSVLMVSDSVIKDPANPASIAKIWHELGHHGRFDFVVIYWLYWSAALALGTGIILLVEYALGFEMPLSGVPALRVVTYIIFGAWSGLSLALIYAVIHRREYVADTYAMTKAPDVFMRFLESRCRYEPHTVVNGVTGFLNRFFHPSFADRLSHQKALERFGARKLFASAFFFSFNIWLLVGVCMQMGPASYLGQGIGSVLQSVAVLGAALFAVWISGHCLKDIWTERAMLTIAERFAYIAGYLSGGLVFLFAATVIVAAVMNNWSVTIPAGGVVAADFAVWVLSILALLSLMRLASKELRVVKLASTLLALLALACGPVFLAARGIGLLRALTEFAGMFAVVFLIAYGLSALIERRNGLAA